MNKLKLILSSFCTVFTLFLFAQNRIISGKVVNAGDRSDIVGATVSVKGSTQVTTSGSDGSFTLSVPSSTVTLVVSSVGFTTKEVAVSGSTGSVTWSWPLQLRN